MAHVKIDLRKHQTETPFDRFNTAIRRISLHVIRPELRLEPSYELMAGTT